MIKTRIPIANFDDFEVACKGHLQKLAKLKNIAQKPYLQNITMNDIKKVIKTVNLNIQIKKTRGKEMLLFDPADKWALLRLMDDDYLSSVMTNQNYEVTGKRPHP